MATITACKKSWNDEGTDSSTSSETQYFLLTVTEENATPTDVARSAYTPDAPAIALGYVAVPKRGQEHPTLTDMVVLSKTAKRAGNGGVPSKHDWVLTVNYGTPEITTGGAPSYTANSRNVVVRVSGVERTIYTMAAVRAGTYGPIRNQLSNTPPREGDVYPDAQELSVYDESISISYETDSINMALISTCRGAVNSSSITMSLPQGDLTFSRTFAARTLQLKAADYQVTLSTSTAEGANKYAYKVDLTLLYRSEGWDRQLPNRGYRWKDSAGKLTEWQPTAEYLDADGKKLAAGSDIFYLPALQLDYEANIGTLLSSI